MYAWLFTDLFAANSFVVFFAAVSFQDRYQEKVKMSKSADFEACVPHNYKASCESGIQAGSCTPPYN